MHREFLGRVSGVVEQRAALRARQQQSTELIPGNREESQRVHAFAQLDAAPEVALGLVATPQRRSEPADRQRHGTCQR